MKSKNCPIILLKGSKFLLNLANVRLVEEGSGGITIDLIDTYVKFAMPMQRFVQLITEATYTYPVTIIDLE